MTVSVVDHFIQQKTPDLRITLTNPTPASAPIHMNFVWKKNSFFSAEKISRPHQKRLLKKMVVDVDKIFSVPYVRHPR